MVEQFVANKDIVDSLKIEGSILPPNEQRWTEFLVGIVDEVIDKDFGQYMPPHQAIKTSGLGDRFVVVDGESFEAIHANWSAASDGATKTLNKRAAAIYLTEGAFVVCRDPLSVFRLSDADMAKRDAIRSLYVIDWLTHEVAHYFQDQNLPQDAAELAFVEAGARYYKQHISDKLHLGFEALNEIDPLAKLPKLYKKLLEGYGDDSHRLFFGTPLQQFHRGEILWGLAQHVTEKEWGFLVTKK